MVNGTSLHMVSIDIIVQEENIFSQSTKLFSFHHISLIQSKIMKPMSKDISQKVSKIFSFCGKSKLSLYDLSEYFFNEIGSAQLIYVS